MSSVKRDGHYIVSVVMGGKSARSRDNYMEALIERTSTRAATRRAFARAEPEHDEAREEGDRDKETSRNEDARPARAEAEKKAAASEARRRIPRRLRSLHAPRRTRRGLQVAAVVPEARPRPAYVAAAAQASRENDEALASPPHAASPRTTAPPGRPDVT